MTTLPTKRFFGYFNKIEYIPDPYNDPEDNVNERYRKERYKTYKIGTYGPVIGGKLHQDESTIGKSGIGNSKFVYIYSGCDYNVNCTVPEFTRRGGFRSIELPTGKRSASACDIKPFYSGFNAKMKNPRGGLYSTISHPDPLLSQDTRKELFIEQPITKIEIKKPCVLSRGEERKFRTDVMTDVFLPVGNVPFQYRSDFKGDYPNKWIPDPYNENNTCNKDYNFRSITNKSIIPNKCLSAREILELRSSPQAIKKLREEIEKNRQITRPQSAPNLKNKKEFISTTKRTYDSFNPDSSVKNSIPYTNNTKIQPANIYLPTYINNPVDQLVMKSRYNQKANEGINGKKFYQTAGPSHYKLSETKHYDDLYKDRKDFIKDIRNNSNKPYLTTNPEFRARETRRVAPKSGYPSF